MNDMGRGKFTFRAWMTCSCARNTRPACVWGAHSLTGGAKGGISALYAKAKQSLSGARHPVTWIPDNGSDRALAPPQYASESANDLAFLSLSTPGDGRKVHDPDLSCLA